jgi:hypothetical protein
MPGPKAKKLNCDDILNYLDDDDDDGLDLLSVDSSDQNSDEDEVVPTPKRQRLHSRDILRSYFYYNYLRYRNCWSFCSGYWE